jgi:hypothetical protein
MRPGKDRAVSYSDPERNFRDFSVERLLRLLMALDRDIDIVIRRKPARRPGRLQIVAAA